MLLAGQPENVDTNCIIERYDRRLLDFSACDLDSFVGVVCNQSLIDARGSVQRRCRTQHRFEELEFRQITPEDE